MANPLHSLDAKSSKTSNSSDQSSDEESEESGSVSSIDIDMKGHIKSKKISSSSKNALSKKTLKRKKLKRKKSPKIISATENALLQVFGTKNGSVNNSSSEKKRKLTRFRFPKSKSSLSGPYSHVKSRYLDVFKKNTSTAEPGVQ